MRSSYVYKIVNILNGKIYIGKSNDPVARWKNYTRIDDKNGMMIRAAIKKYGIDRFLFSVLEELSTEEEAFRRESELIIEHRSNDPMIGYNMNEGGIGGARPCALTRARISKVHAGKTLSLERRKSMRKIDDQQIVAIIDRLDHGASLNEISKELRCTASCLSSFLTRHGFSPRVRIQRWPWCQRWALKRNRRHKDRSYHCRTPGTSMLKPGDEDAIREYYFHSKLTMLEIAARLGVTHGSVRAAVSRIRRSINQETLAG